MILYNKGMGTKVNPKNYVNLICSVCEKTYSMPQSVYYYTHCNRKLQEDFCSKTCYGKWLGAHHGWGKEKEHATRPTINEIGRAHV